MGGGGGGGGGGGLYEEMSLVAKDPRLQTRCFLACVINHQLTDSRSPTVSQATVSQLPQQQATTPTVSQASSNEVHLSI